MTNWSRGRGVREALESRLASENMEVGSLHGESAENQSKVGYPAQSVQEPMGRVVASPLCLVSLLRTVQESEQFSYRMKEIATFRITHFTIGKMPTLFHPFHKWQLLASTDVFEKSTQKASN